MLIFKPRRKITEDEWEAYRQAKMTQWLILTLVFMFKTVTAPLTAGVIYTSCLLLVILVCSAKFVKWLMIE